MAVTWNPSDASANITLSGGNLTATTTSGTQAGVRATTSAASGKVYFSIVATGPTALVGFATASAPLGTQIGTTTASVALNLTNGQVRINNSVLATLYVVNAGQLVEVAWDITNKLIWFRIALGYWNNNPANDPGLGVGGISTATIAAGPYFPIWSAASSGASNTAQFGAKSPLGPIPAGFSTLDTNTQNYMAAASFKGYATLSGFQHAMSVASLKMYGVLGGFQNAMSVAKMLGYAIVYPLIVPGESGNFPVPQRRKRRVPFNGDVWGSFPPDIPPAPPPQPSPSLWDPVRRRRRYQPPTWTFTPPAPVANNAPFPPAIEPIFLRHRREMTLLEPAATFRAVFDDFWVTRIN